MQLEEVSAWDQSRPETLKRYPLAGPHQETPKEFELMRQGYVRELQQRLDWLRHCEQTKNDPADGLSIECQLGRIALYAGAKSPNLFYGSVNTINRNFPPEQKQVLRELLRKIELDRPWRGVSMLKAYEYRDKFRGSMPEGCRCIQQARQALD